MYRSMGKITLIFLVNVVAYSATCNISDTLDNPFGGKFAGKITVSLNSPGNAQPLYSGSTTLTGWQTTITVPSSGVVSFSLVCTDSITPSGSSYTARYQPNSGSGWIETWTPATGTTTIRAMRATTVPTPTTTIQPSQIAGTGATTGDCLIWSGTAYGPDTCGAGGGGSGTVTTVSVATANGVSGTVANATTTPAITLALGAITPTSVAASGNVTGANLSGTNTGDQTNITGNAATATALAANPADCSAGQYATTIAASGDLTCAQVAYGQISGTPTLAAVATSGSASDLSTGTLAAARGGAGTVNGIMKANGSGTVSAASAGTDYVAPNGSITGNAATATALAANGANCSSGQYPLGVDASGAAEGCTAAATTVGYAIQFWGNTQSSPADATTYYFGNAPAQGLDTNATWYRVYVPQAGTIKAVYGNLHTGGATGSGESSSIYVRVNNTTDVTVTTSLTTNSVSNPFSATGLSQAVSAGDYLEIKWVTPTWATNPTNIRASAVVYIE